MEQRGIIKVWILLLLISPLAYAQSDTSSPTNDEETTLQKKEDKEEEKKKKDPLLFVDKDKLKVRGHIQMGVNAVAETNLFWNLADVPQLDFNSDTRWLEFYVKPGLSFSWSTGKNSTLYGKISGVGSYTAFTDAFDSRNTGRFTLEEAYLGYNFKIAKNTTADISAGSRELKLGTGMLIANGGSSGFERGALKLGPRKAWEKAAIVEITHKNKLNGKVFYIEPNELASNKTDNSLLGADVNYYDSLDKYLGVSYVRVLNSLAPYPKAAPNGNGPPVITPGAREGLNAINVYAKARPFEKSFNNLFTVVDFAYQWNDRIDLNAIGGRIQVGVDFPKVFWKPTLMYSYQGFSGDDPDTEKLERFDPLFYEGSPSAWATGTKSSMVFINSNVQSNGLTLRTMPTRKDIITYRYARISAQKLRSPIQFGQATRTDFSNNIPSVVAGVTNNHLADDFFIEYNRIVNKNVFLNAGFSISFPGRGIRNVTNSTANWTGGYVNLVINY